MIQLEIRITLKSPLHIGALSPAGTAAVRGLLKNKNGWPFIPASSFKGRVRHAVERLAHGLNYYVCETHREMCRGQDKICPVCQVFGSPWVPGAVNFVDFPLTGPPALVAWRDAPENQHKIPKTTERYGVGISRTRKVAADHLLYTTELFQPGVPLEFGGTVAPPSLETAAWLVAGVRYLDSLGGDRTRGLGWITGETVVRDEAGQTVVLETLRTYLEPR